MHSAISARRLTLVLALVVSIMTWSSNAAVAGDLTSENWRVFNAAPATAYFWDIDHVTHDSSGALTFPINAFDTKTTGSFVVYLINNYNNDLTGKALEATMSWTQGTYDTRSEACGGAYVRFEFQDTTSGPYDSNDYWWSAASFDLNATASGTLAASLADRASWSNISGKFATDETANWVDYNGNVIADSPYDGFTRALTNVKQLSLSFGSSCRFASGVALVGGNGKFTVSSFEVK